MVTFAAKTNNFRDNKFLRESFGGLGSVLCKNNAKAREKKWELGGWVE